MYNKLTLFVLLMLASSAALADPTRPAPGIVVEQKEVSANKPLLQAIFVTEAGKKAIVNGTTYLESQQKNGLTVLAISTSEVEVEFMQNGERKREVLSLANSHVVVKSEADKN